MDRSSLRSSASDGPAERLAERLAERGLHASRITGVEQGYRVHVRGWTLLVDHPAPGVALGLWAMHAASEIARTLGVA